VFGVTLVAGAAFSISLELSMQGYPMQEMFWMGEFFFPPPKKKDDLQ
jgi:hypothetical protein